MFHLQDSDLKQFFEDQKKELNEELRELVNVYEHSVHKARHVELQILDWQNAHNDEVIAAGRGLQQWSESFVADDLKSKFEQTNQYLTDLSNHQQALDEQIETLMSLKQPVQHETTYLLKNSQDPNQAYNVTVLSGKQVQPKLTYEQFCQRLYSQEQDSESVEHLVKQETAQMVNGLLELQRSVLGAAQSVDEAETVAKCKEKSTHIQQLIQRINKLDRLAFMTVIEHGKLKTQLLSMKKVRTSETASMSHQIEQVHDRRKQIQNAMEAEMKRLRDQHDQVLTAQTSHLVAQKKQLRMQLQLLHAHSHSSSHRPTYEDKVSENDMPSVNSQNRNQSSSHSKSHTINTSISKRNSVRGTAENKKDFVDPLITLQNVVTQAKSRFLNLERRNQLEMEGYANEVLFLRQRLRQLEKSRVRMSQYESFS